MARKRQIDPDLWTKKWFMALSLGARLLYLGMVNHADDEGRLEADPMSLKAKIFPADPETPDKVLEYRAEIEGQKQIYIYSNGNDEYLVLPKYTDEQYMTKRFPSRRPPPPQEVIDQLLTTQQQVNDVLHGDGGGVGDGNGIGIGSEDADGAGAGNGSITATAPHISTNNNQLITVYQQCSGYSLTGAALKRLELLESKYETGWIISAFEEAVNKTGKFPGWTYIEKILERWRVDGKGSRGRHRARDEPTSPREYLDSYQHLIRPTQSEEESGKTDDEVG